MKTRILLSLLALAALCCSCGHGKRSDEAQKAIAEAKTEGIAFLREMGIDASQVVVDSVINVWGDQEQRPMIPLSEKQVVALLKDVPAAGLADSPVAPKIVAVHPMRNDHTLVAYWMEGGDGYGILMVTYDKSGKVKDAISTGSWSQVNDYSMVDGGMGDVLTDSTICHLGGDSIVLDRKVSRLPVAGDKQGPAIWTVERSYVYAMADDGTLDVQAMKTVRQTGKPVDGDPSLTVFFDLADLDRYPQTGKGQMERLDQLASAIKPETSEFMDLTHSASLMFETNRERFLLWIANHRQNHVMPVFEAVFSKGFVEKNELYQAIKVIKDARAKQYLEQVTAQWGPKELVG